MQESILGQTQEDFGKTVLTPLPGMLHRGGRCGTVDTVKTTLTKADKYARRKRHTAIFSQGGGMSPRKMAVGMSHVGLERDHDRLMSHLDQFAEDTRFLESIRPELQNKYPDYWIAVYKREIVATASTLRELVKELVAKDIPPSQVVLAYLRTEPIAMIL